MADDYVGAKLRITTEESSYEGIVHSIDPVRRRLTLTKVISCTKGKPPKNLHGFQNFFGPELNNLEILDRGDSNKDTGKDVVKNNTSQEWDIGFSSNFTKAHSTALPSSSSHTSTIPKEQTTIYHPTTTSHKTQSAAQASVFRNAIKGAGMQVKRSTQAPGRVTKDASDEGAVLLKRPPLAAEQYLTNDYYSDEDEELSPQSPPKTIILQDHNDRFQNAVKYINSQRVVGLSCEGVNLGRYGKICWLVIGCRHFTYLFDIISLGDSCFQSGLAEILENGNILKVAHDCRQMSDALFHQYSIDLVNVFDTQVADIIIYKREKGGNLPRTVNGLVGCLYEYLNLSPEQCHFQKVRISNMKKDEAIWSRRPLSQQVTDSASKRVMYLRELRLAQMERMMAEFIFGVNIYLSIVRDAKDYKVTDKRYMSKARHVPQQFQELYKFHHRQRNRKFDEDFADDAREEQDEQVPAHTSVWQEGEQFTDTYRNRYGRLREQCTEPLPGWYGPSEPEGRGRGTGTDTGTTTREQFTEPLPGWYGPSEPIGRGRGTGTDTGTTTREQFTEPLPGWYGPSGPEGRGRGTGTGTGTDTTTTEVHEYNYTEGIQEDEKDNAFQFKFSSFGETVSNDLRGVDISPSQIADSNSRSASSGVHDTRDLAAKYPLGSTVFNEEDFPPLSDSESSASFSSTPPRPRPAASAVYPADSRLAAHRAREETGISPQNSYSLSPLASDSGLVGRGRASLFQHMSNIPHVRLPHMDDEPPRRNPSDHAVGGLMNRHTFPTDNELLASSQVTLVPDSASIRGGTRVRVKQT